MTLDHSAVHVAARAVRAARRGVAPLCALDPLGDEHRDQLGNSLPNWVAQRRGWIYLAGNVAWPDLLKIGCTRKGVPARLHALSGTGVLTPWEPRAVWAVYDAPGLEAICHAACSPWHRRAELFAAPRQPLEHAIRRALLIDKATLLQQLGGLLIPGELHDLLRLEHVAQATS